MDDREHGDGIDAWFDQQIEREAYELMTPTISAFMQRVDQLGQTESMWIHCYQSERLMVETLPPVKMHVAGHAVGVVREIPVRRDAWMQDLLSARVRLHSLSGWVGRAIEVPFAGGEI